ncbi:hypothetical protein IAG41_14810 [Sphingomonas sp. JC676]|nr:hypothetical protein [Sphingomonas sp. JC676]MBC9033666.1 hypothetical protein [Sphingomonas sp. JC676]
MKRALVALITATVLSGLAAAYASAYPRAEAPAKTAPTAKILAKAR